MTFTAWKDDCYYGLKYLATLLHEIAEGNVPAPTEPVPFRQLTADTLAWLKVESEQCEHALETKRIRKMIPSLDTNIQSLEGAPLRIN
jgi:hypothetical protein